MSGASRSTASPALHAATTNPPGATDTVGGAILRGLIKLPESTHEFLPPYCVVVRVPCPLGRAAGGRRIHGQSCQHLGRGYPHATGAGRRATGRSRPFPVPCRRRCPACSGIPAAFKTTSGTATFSTPCATQPPIRRGLKHCGGRDGWQEKKRGTGVSPALFMVFYRRSRRPGSERRREGACPRSGGGSC